jgi:hypothetical protein
LGSVIASLGMIVPHASTTEAPQFTLQLTYWVLVPGEMRRIRISPADIIVTYANDYGTREHEVWRSTTTQPEARRLFNHLRQLPLDTLYSTYSRGDVDDGFSLHFSIQLSDHPKKDITMSNAWQPDLRRLCIEVNSLVPERFRIKVPKPNVLLPDDIRLEVVEDDDTDGD